MDVLIEVGDTVGIVRFWFHLLSFRNAFERIENSFQNALESINVRMMCMIRRLFERQSRLEIVQGSVVREEWNLRHVL